MTLDDILRGIDRACDRLARRVATRLDRRAIRQSTAIDDIVLMIETGIRDAMIASHLLAVPKTIACDEISKVLSKLPRREKDALRELYGSIARSATGQAMSRVREKLMKDVAAAVKGGTARDVRRVLRSIGIGNYASSLVKTIARTQTSMAYNAAAWSRDNEDDRVWGYEYVTAGDERVRESHVALDGIRYPKNHEFWKRYAPPNGWNCRCSLRPVFGRSKIVPYRGIPEVDPTFQFNPGRIFTEV